MRRKRGRNGALKEPGKKTIAELIGPNLEWILVEMANRDFVFCRKRN